MAKYTDTRYIYCPCHIKIMPQHKSVGAISILLSYYTTPSQEVCSLLFALRLRSHLMTYLLYLPLPQGLIYHPEQVNIFQGICLVVFLPVCQAFYDHPMPYTYLHRFFSKGIKYRFTHLTSMRN